MTGDGMDRVGQRLLAITAAGCAAVTFPLLAAADVDSTVAGLPVLYVYLFLVWSAIIAAMALVINRRR